MSDRRSLTVLGVTGAGKSTWIGALADGLYRGGVSRVVLDQSGWPEDTAGFDRVREYIQNGRFPIHTSEEQRALVELPLRLAAGPHKDDAFTLKMSDYDGELIEKLFLERTQGWDDAWLRRAHADCFLLLLRHDFTKGLRALRRPPVGGGHGRPPPGLTASSPDELGASPLPDLSLPEAPTLASDDPTYVPTALALIELLQWIRDERGLLPGAMTPPERPLRIGVVFTAWDAVDVSWKQEPPEHYLAAHHAILRDFLACNFREDEVRVFALSATGGNLDDLAYRERYLNADIPCSRVWWRAPDGNLASDVDLSVPLCWALYGESGITG